MEYQKTITLKDGRECCLRNGTEKDGKATTRLKEMMRASYLLADNLNRVAGLSGSLNTIELPELSEGKTKEAKKRFKKIDDCIKAKKGSSALSESWECAMSGKR